MFRLTAIVLIVCSASTFAQTTNLEPAVREIFVNKCAFSGCHAGNKPAAKLALDGEDYAAKLVNMKSATAPQFLRVAPGNVTKSYLIRKVKGQGIKGARMPRGRAPLSNAEIAVLERWVSILPSELAPSVPARRYTQAFYGWSLANVPTAETLPRGGFLYRIAHRFRGTIDTGFSNLFGLDGGAFAMTQLAFPLCDNLNLSVARQGLNATFEIGVKLRFLRERNDGKVPISAALYAGTAWATVGGLPDPNNINNTLGLFNGERFAFFAQAPVTKSLGNRFAVVVAPSVLFNGNVTLANENALVAFALGGKYNFSKKYAFFAELTPIVSGDATAATVNGQRMQGNNLVFKDTFVFGFELKSGGHEFHIFVSNSAGNTTPQYLSGGDLLGNDLRLGFNIYRMLNYPAF